jgi:hypothetical protein
VRVVVAKAVHDDWNSVCLTEKKVATAVGSTAKPVNKQKLYSALNRSDEEGDQL